MDPFTYATLLGLVFLFGVFVFMRFETPRKMLNRGINTLDKGLTRLRNIQVIHLGRNTKKTPLTIGRSEDGMKTHLSGTDGNNETGFYVHEY